MTSMKLRMAEIKRTLYFANIFMWVQGLVLRVKSTLTGTRKTTKFRVGGPPHLAII